MGLGKQKRKKAWIKRKNVNNPKVNGELRIKDLKLFNMSLLCENGGYE